jgi:hypothetical protein
LTHIRFREKFFCANFIPKHCRKKLIKNVAVLQWKSAEKINENIRVTSPALDTLKNFGVV